MRLSRSKKNKHKGVIFMSNKFQSINEVTVQGVIVHQFCTDKVAILTINTGNSTPVINYPKVVFFDKLDEISKDYKVGDHVCVKGNIQSSKRKSEIKNQITQSIFGETIKKTQSLMENAFNITSVKNSYKPFENTFRVAGTIVSLRPLTANTLGITLRTHKNGHVSFVRLVHFAKNMDKLLSELHPGDFVCGVGCVQTAKKNTKKGVSHFEDFVVLELGKPEPKE